MRDLSKYLKLEISFGEYYYRNTYQVLRLKKKVEGSHT